MMRTFLFIVYDIVSHIERKINYFIFIFILFILACDPDRVRGAAREVGDGGGPTEVHQHEHLPGQGGPLVLAEAQVWASLLNRFGP
jgi:hypothetical protein